jgi:murein DD-endopeptidase MepM/ murein hydrolase activator NlpD
VHPRQLLALTLLLSAATTILLTGWGSPAAGLSNSARDRGWAEHRWSWPVAPVPSVLRSYRAPLTEYAAGHRGIDVAVPTGTSVTSPDDGVVLFAGAVGGRPVLSVQHGGGLVSSFEPLDAVVVRGQAVRRGDALGTVAPSAGHCPIDCLHLGARVDGRYVSPMVLLGDVPRAILLPLAAQPGASGARVSLFVRALEPLG